MPRFSIGRFLLRLMMLHYSKWLSSDVKLLNVVLATMSLGSGTTWMLIVGILAPTWNLKGGRNIPC